MKRISTTLPLALLFLLAQMAQARDVRDSFGDAGQFFAYHEAADREMSAIIKNVVGSTPPPSRLRLPVQPQLPAPAGIQSPESSTAAPRVDRALPVNAIMAYADRFWHGRALDLSGALSRIEQIRPNLERILEEEGVPPPFAAVVLVESGANPQALSPKDARGLWQILPGTARRFGLTVDYRRDDRTDLLKSTHAAARYLRNLYQTFGDWRLALAAYNAGEGTVKSATRTAGSHNFQVLSDRRLIPAETRAYVPAVLAAVTLLQMSPVFSGWVADSSVEMRR